MKGKNSRQERAALFVATLTSFMGPFMISSVNVALPTIQKDLNMNAVQLSWVATAYLLATAVGLLPAGKIADMRGRKKIFTIGVAIFTVTATLAAFSNSAAVFILLRVLQGLGSALFVATGVAILTSIFPPQKRGKVIGIYVAAVYIGLSMGPFIGGILTQHLGWRSIFWLMLPLGGAALWLIVKHLEGEWCSEEKQQLDLPGCVLYGVSMIMLVYGASRLPNILGITLLAIAAGGLVLFVYQQKNSRYPLVELSLFSTNKIFAFSSYAALLNYSASFGVTFLLSLYLQYIKGLPPQHAGVILMAQPVMMAVFSPITGHLSDRIEPRYLASTGMLMSVIGMFILSRLTADTSILLIVSTLFFIGIGFALFSSPNMSAMMGAVEKRQYGVASGLISTMRLLGQMTSMAIVTVVLAMFIGRKAIVRENYEQFLTCIGIVFFISGCLCLLGTYFSWYRGSVQKHQSEL